MPFHRKPDVRSPLIAVFPEWGMFGQTAMLFPEAGADPVELAHASANPKEMRDFHSLIEQEAEMRGGILVRREGHCTQCGKIYDDFMLKQEVWEQAWPHGELGYLCFACTEKNLGRPLHVEDFTHAPINRGIRMGFKMAHYACMPDGVTALGGYHEVLSAMNQIERLQHLKRRHDLPDDWEELVSELDRRLSAAARRLNADEEAEAAMRAAEGQDAEG